MPAPMTTAATTKRQNCDLHLSIVSPGPPAMLRWRESRPEEIAAVRKGLLTITESNMKKVMQKLQRVGACRSSNNCLFCLKLPSDYSTILGMYHTAQSLRSTQRIGSRQRRRQHGVIVLSIDSPGDLPPGLDSENGGRTSVAFDDIRFDHRFHVELVPVLRRLLQHLIEIRRLKNNLAGSFGALP